MLADANHASSWSRKLADKAGELAHKKAATIVLGTGDAIVRPLDGMKSHVVWADDAGLLIVDFYPGDDFKAGDVAKLAKTIPGVPVFRPARRAGTLTITSGMLAVLDPAKSPTTKKHVSDAVGKAKASAIPGCAFVPLRVGDYQATFEVLGKGSATYEDDLGEYAPRLRLEPA